MSDVLERTLAGLRAALAVTPDNGPLRLQVAELLHALGRANEALEAARAARRHLEADSEAAERCEALIDELAPPPDESLPDNVADLSSARRDHGGFRVLGEPEPMSDHLAAMVGPERERVDFSDVGGLDELKEAIRMKIVLPFEKPEIFAAYGKRRGGGLLLYGPPGCGKTLLARATAGEVGASFMSVAIDQVLDMWFGQSEAKLAELFEEARRQAPTVLFFDEVEAIGGSRQQLRNGPGATLVNQLLSQMDGVDSANDQVLVMAATNAPWHVDSALLRPGRFDQVVFVPPPDEPARVEILRLLLRERPVADALDLAGLGRDSEGLSGADLADVVERAVEGPLKEALRTGEVRPVGEPDLRTALKGSRSSTEDWFATAKNYATFANAGGLYEDLVAYLEQRASKPKKRWWWQR